MAPLGNLLYQFLLVNGQIIAQRQFVLYCVQESKQGRQKIVPKLFTFLSVYYDRHHLFQSNTG